MFILWESPGKSFSAFSAEGQFPVIASVQTATVPTTAGEIGSFAAICMEPWQ